MMPSSRRPAVALLSQHVVPRLKKQFNRHCNADDVFPILTPFQTKVAWSQFSKEQVESARGPAAVLIPIISFHNKDTNEREFHVVFTQRSSHMRTHAAEISFPGGGFEGDVDADLIDTALRETQEELLHDPSFEWTVIGQGSVIPSIRGIPVTPILAIGSSTTGGDSTGSSVTSLSSSSNAVEQVFPGSPDEVQRVFSISINDLLDAETSKPLPGRLGTPAPVFPVRIAGELDDDDDGNDNELVNIWGLTAFVLQPILHKVLKPALVVDSSNRFDDGTINDGAETNDVGNKI